MTAILTDDQASGNPRAASVRIESDTSKGHADQRRHDLRIGKPPKNVDPERIILNRVLIETPTASAMKMIAVERRARRETKRAMKSNVAISTAGIITFGSEAAIMFEQLTSEQQDAALGELAQAVADRLNTSLHGLVVHLDEATLHAHFTLSAYDHDGHPLSQTTRPKVLSELQDLTAEVMGRHCPGIERGTRYGDRLAAGADFADVMHKSVRQLHRELPADLEKKRARLVELAAAEVVAQERVAEMHARVEKLRLKGELTVKELKRLATYESRLADRVQDLEQARRASEAVRLEEERLAGIAREDRAAQEKLAEVARQKRADQERAAVAITAKVEAVRQAVVALSDEVAAGTILRTEEGKIRAKAPERLKPGFPELGPAVAAAADLGSEIASVRTGLEQDRQEIEEDRRDLEAGQRDLVRQTMALGAQKAEVESLRDRLRRALAVVGRWLKRPDLTAEARHDGEDLLRHAGPLVMDPFSASKEPIPPGGPGL